MDKTIRDSGDALDFTMQAAGGIQKLIRRGTFSEQESRAIYLYLRSSIEGISFSKYLKRYIYRHFKLPGAFEEITDRDYKYLITAAFMESRTPKAFHETTSTLNVLVSGWLRARSVSRETVFLLGFALGMSIDEVSEFLVKGIHEQDFRMDDPDEVIFWYCLKNRLSARKAMELKQTFRQQSAEPREAGTGEQPDVDVLYTGFSGTTQVSEEELLSYLLAMDNARTGENAVSLPLECFRELMQQAREEIAVMYREDAVFENDSDEGPAVRDADVEHVLYNGVPVDRKGNLFKISQSMIGVVVPYRLTRQRISRILAGTVPVSRQDLITLEFFICTVRAIDEPEKIRRRFIRRMDRILRKCRMGDLNVSNAYEAFVLLCLFTEDPFAAFSEVWEYSYSGDEAL